MRLLKLTITALLLLGSIAAAAELKVGDVAPAFDLPGSDGKSYALADYQNQQYVVIAFFPKAHTGG
ncbi:MAG: peroxiredoxin Q/BCP [Candidatus Pseudothioglobus sp.]|jgi:peroxiredoxin Q/BCP